MKKIYKYSLFFILIFFITLGVLGVYSKNYVIATSSNSDTNSIIYTFDNINNSTIDIKMVESKFNAKKTIKSEDLNIVIEMLTSLDKCERINPIDDIDSLFKIYLTINEEKFILEVYGDDILEIYPWDGYRATEFISAKKLPNSLNPESICNYIFKN